MFGVQQVNRVALEFGGERLPEGKHHGFVIRLREQLRGPGLEVHNRQARLHLDAVRGERIGTAGEDPHRVPCASECLGLRAHHDVHATGVFRAWHVERRRMQHDKADLQRRGSPGDTHM